MLSLFNKKGVAEWAGIQLVSSPGLGDLKVGDIVTVTGSVGERSGMTVIEFISEMTIDGNSEILPP